MPLWTSGLSHFPNSADYGKRTMRIVSMFRREHIRSGKVHGFESHKGRLLSINECVRKDYAYKPN